jgi:dihydroxy-acid dehydratase
MPEAGYLPIPTKLARRGVKDMLRISDARMSGTAFGTIVLHVSPDAASGGPLGLVESGDTIAISVANRTITLHVAADELVRRRQIASQTVASPVAKRGYDWLHSEFITQAEHGCDFRFLRQIRSSPD